MKNKLAMVGVLAMLNLQACQSGSSVSEVSEVSDWAGVSGLSEGGEVTFASAMSEVEAGHSAVLLWVQGIACPF